jgi:hypothetical protein
MELGKTTKISAMIVGVPAEIQTTYHQNIRQKCHCMNHSALQLMTEIHTTV